MNFIVIQAQIISVGVWFPGLFVLWFLWNEVNLKGDEKEINGLKSAFTYT